MAEVEIERDAWPSFGARFTEQHRGWLTSATRRTARGREHALWRGAALERVDLDLGAGRVVCVARVDGSQDAAVVSVTNEGPSRVVQLVTPQGGHAGLRVETADGGALELRFRVSAAPETVDGLA